MADGSFNNFSGSVLFLNNSASGRGDSIFASSLQNCLQASDYDQLTNLITNWTNFHFIQEDSQKSIQTHAVKIELNSTADDKWNVYPGKLFKPSIQLIDERGNCVMGTVNVSTNANISVETNPAFALNREWCTFYCICTNT